MSQNSQDICEPTGAESSMPATEKENQDLTECTTTPDKKAGATEMTPRPPHLVEEVVLKVDIKTKDVGNSNASITVKHKKNEKQKAVLKYKYKEDQWSPINLEGKKQYDRDFLLQLQNSPESMLNPLDLPDIPEIKRHSLQLFITDDGNFVDFTPRYVWSGGPSRSGGVLRRAKDGLGKGVPLIKKDYEMHHDKAARKPMHQTDKINQSEEDPESEVLYRKVRSILNKVTPQNFQMMVAKMQTLQIDSETRLINVADLLFENAICEPGKQICTVYANMCKCLCSFKVPSNRKKKKQSYVNCQAVLLTRFQQAYEKIISFTHNIYSERTKIKKAAMREENQQMNRELTCEEMKAKRRISLGFIWIIGELFRVKMLTERNMHDCVFRLLRSKDEENIEYLCILLKTIGKELETEKTKLQRRMDEYFTQMEKIVNKKKLSSRVRFMLQDVIELRQSKWVLRKDDNNPKTIDEIRREVAQEEQDWAILILNLPQVRSRRQPGGPMCSGTDGWNRMTQMLLRADQFISPSKLRLDKGTMSCIHELRSTDNLHLFVYSALNQALERSEVARRKTGLLLHDLVNKDVISVETYIKELNEVLMYADDMEIDIPMFWEYLGQLISPMVLDGSVPISFLKQLCEPLRANNKGSILIAKILHDASHREGHQKVTSLWAHSGLQWSDFLPNSQIHQFLADEKLEFTKGGDTAVTSPATGMTIQIIEESLNDMIVNMYCSNVEVFDWIERNVDEPMTKHKHFIHALMMAVCRRAVTTSSNNLMKVDKSQIQRRNNLLQKYLDHRTEFELQALYALQKLVHRLEHPPGVLQELFDILYDEDIIAEDAFIQWEKSEDPQEQEGKGMAVKQVVQFLTWLKQAKDKVDS